MAYYLNVHVIDWDKVESIEDIKAILATLELAWVNPPSGVKHLTKYVDRDDQKVLDN